MKLAPKFTITLSIFFVLAIIFPVHSQTISADLIKKNIQKRLNERNELIKDYQCDLITHTVSSTPRGDMERESKYQIYFKSPDKHKAEFIEGKRGGRKYTADDMKRRNGDRRGRRGGDRRGMGAYSGLGSPFDIGKYLDEISVGGTENIDGNATYKLKIKVTDKDDQFKSIVVWVDQKTFDVVKYKATLRPNERLDSGSVEITFAPISPEGVWLPQKGTSERYMIFNTPMGEMEIEAATTITFENYKFNIGIKDEIFESEKK